MLDLYLFEAKYFWLWFKKDSRLIQSNNISEIRSLLCLKHSKHIFWEIYPFWQSSSANSYGIHLKCFSTIPSDSIRCLKTVIGDSLILTSILLTETKNYFYNILQNFKSICLIGGLPVLGLSLKFFRPNFNILTQYFNELRK